MLVAERDDTFMAFSASRRNDCCAERLGEPAALCCCAMCAIRSGDTFDGEDDDRALGDAPGVSADEAPAIAWKGPGPSDVAESGCTVDSLELRKDDRPEPRFDRGT